MAYLGNAPARSFISFEKQVFTIVNSQTAYTLSHSVNNENDIRLVINNIVQEPGSGKAYTASGTTLTLSAALVNGTDEMYCVFLGRAVATNKPGAGSVGTSQLASDAVTEAKIADDAVESEHLNDNVISGQTELAAEPADTDEFLVSDAGTLQRIDYSLIKGEANTPAFAAYSSAITLSSGVTTKLSVGEVYDTNSAYDGTTFTIPSGEDGKYFIFLNGSHYATSSDATVGYVRIYLNGSNSRIGELYNISSFRNHHNNVSASLSLSAGDTIEAYASTNGSGSIGLGTVNFGAFKIST